MKHLLVALCALLLLFPFAISLADDVEIIVIDIVPTTTPVPVCMTPPPPTPEPTPLPDLPDYDYDKSWSRALSRGTWSVCPDKPTESTKHAFCEVILNRVDDETGDFKDDAPHVLSQGNEFMDYDSDAFRSRENDAIADYVMRAWTYYHVTGSRAYMLTPADGLYCDFYEKPDNNGWDYIKVYNRAGDIVFDSGLLR